MSYKYLRTLSGHSGPVNSVRFTKDGNYVMTCSDDRTLKLWNPLKCDHTNTDLALCIKTYGGVHGYSVQDVALSTDNNKFASVGGDRAAFLWDVGTGRVIRRFQGHSHRINCCIMNEDSTLLLTGSYDKTVRIWDLKSNMRDPIQTLDNFRDSVTAIKITDSEIITSCVDGYIRIYDLRTGMLQMDHLGEAISSINITYDNKCIISSCLDGTIRLTELSTGRLLQYYTGHQNNSFKIEACVTNDDGHIISGSETGEVLLWDLVEARLLRKTKAHEKCVSSVAYHPKQKVFVTASFDGTAKVWEDSR